MIVVVVTYLPTESAADVLSLLPSACVYVFGREHCRFVRRRAVRFCGRTGPVQLQWRLSCWVCLRCGRHQRNCCAVPGGTLLPGWRWRLQRVCTRLLLHRRVDVADASDLPRWPVEPCWQQLVWRVRRRLLLSSCRLQHTHTCPVPVSCRVCVPASVHGVYRWHVQPWVLLSTWYRQRHGCHMCWRLSDDRSVVPE